ncbi:hypothetical protein SVAN01_08994 [Stagonosporopsis vannaccii]|nr:hypothetical protein SVAN01_08994 [Stagonosporopsis vannaccii]
MFAQLFDAAKRAISRTPSYQGAPSEAREEVPEIPTSDPAPQDTTDTAKMVTTRRGTETPSLATPASSSKKRVGKRELEALDTPTQAKRQRKTVVEVTRTLRSTPRKGGAATNAESTQDSADEAVSETEEATPKPEKTSPLAIRRRSSPRVVVEPSSPVTGDAPTQDGFHTPEPASSEAAFVTPFTSKKALQGSPTPKAAKTETPAAAKKARGRPKKAQKDEVQEEIPSSTQESSVASPAVAPPKAHVRFGSEEPSVNAKGHTRYEAPAAPTPAVEDEDSADDSDEAPEMVSTSAAASKAAAAQADTSRALAALQEKERKKREAREQRIAAEQAAKRERDALKAQKAAARAAKAARLSSVAEVPSDAEEDSTSTHTNIPRASLPSLLPTSLLDTLGDVRPPTPPPETRGKTDEQLRAEKLNHHIKFLEQSSKTPKDKRVGKHHVAVLVQARKALPPKVSRDTKGVREAWLKGRQGQGVKGKPRVGKTQRVKFGAGGFLRGED